MDASSPAPAPYGSRKRLMEDQDSSFTSNQDDSPVGAQSNPNTFSRLTAGRVLQRATSTASLNAASRRRGSGMSGGGSCGAASSNFLSAFMAAGGAGDAATVSSIDSSSRRHRKMSRGTDGRPTLLKNGRRTHSMCDSEYYASPPLETDGDSQEYFASQHTMMAHNGISPDDALSPARAQKPTGLNSYQPSPEASFTSGFGHKEAQGKVLPCQSVKEDGLMRITSATVGSYRTEEISR